MASNSSGLSGFDLNQALREWRARMAAASPCRPEDLDEMESHLRDSIRTWEGQGLTPQEAFRVAAGRLGNARELADEWAKVRPAALFRQRLVWMLVGMLLFCFVGDLARVVSGAAVLWGSGLGWEPARLGWMGLAGGLATLLVAGVVPVGMALGRWRWLSGVCRDRVGRSFQWMVLVFGLVLVARLAAWMEPMVLVRELDAAALGGVYSMRAWGQVAGGFLFLLVAVGLLMAFVNRDAGTLRAGMAGALILGLLGAGLPSRVEAAPAETAAKPDSKTFDETLRLWRTGKKEEALRHFAAVDFTRRPLFRAGTPLAYSEKDFVALPREVNSKLQPVILEEVQGIKSLAQGVKEAASAAAKQGDSTKSALYMEQLRKCGKALEHPDSLAMLKLIGKALTRMASESPGASGAPKAP